MHLLKIVLSDAAFKAAQSEARLLDIDVSTYCANLLADCLASTSERSLATDKDESSVQQIPTSQQITKETKETQVNLENAFHAYPDKSRRYAQAICDEALKIPGVTAKFDPRKGHKSVMFEPNFLVIEYLLSKGTRAGIAISLGVNKAKYRNPPPEIKDGRTESYSRILIETDDVLQKSLPLVRETFNLRYSS
jgi:hypothetical protein